LPRCRELTQSEIEEELQGAAEGMINASFARDEQAYYEWSEQHGQLRHMLKQLKSEADEQDS